eukprot:gene15047-16600_t
MEKHREASINLLNRRHEIEATTTARQKQITKMLAHRTSLVELHSTVNRWNETAEEMERLSQGNPSLRSFREARSIILNGVSDVRVNVKELDESAIPQFNAVRDAIERLDVILKDDQPTGSNVEELRFTLGEARGTLEVIIGLLYS